MRTQLETILPLFVIVAIAGFFMALAFSILGMDKLAEYAAYTAIGALATTCGLHTYRARQSGLKNG